MGGTIEFDTHKNIGTTFVVCIPFEIDVNAPQQAEASEKIHDLTGMHILIAEDNELNMEIAEFMVAEKGAAVTKAWNGREAVEQFARLPRRQHRPYPDGPDDAGAGRSGRRAADPPHEPQRRRRSPDFRHDGERFQRRHRRLP